MLFSLLLLGLGTDEDFHERLIGGVLLLHHSASHSHLILDLGLNILEVGRLLILGVVRSHLAVVFPILLADILGLGFLFILHCLTAQSFGSRRRVLNHDCLGLAVRCLVFLASTSALGNFDVDDLIVGFLI